MRHDILFRGKRIANNKFCNICEMGGATLTENVMI